MTNNKLCRYAKRETDYCCNCGDCGYAMDFLMEMGFDVDDEHYTPSATRGDYSPANPWDAPGMKVSDFI